MSVPRLSELAGIIHNPSQPFLIPPLPPGFVPSADKQPVACGGWNAASLGSQAPTIEVHGSDQDQARSASHFQITGIGFSGIQVTPDEPLSDRRFLKPSFFLIFMEFLPVLCVAFCSRPATWNCRPVSPSGRDCNRPRPQFPDGILRYSCP